jgi:hypothetical protein
VSDEATNNDSQLTVVLVHGALPSWAVVATGDKAVGTDVLRTMAERAGATITEAEGSHVIMISRPELVADVISTAAATLDRSVAAGAR